MRGRTDMKRQFSMANYKIYRSKRLNGNREKNFFQCQRSTSAQKELYRQERSSRNSSDPPKKAFPKARKKNTSIFTDVVFAVFKNN